MIKRVREDRGGFTLAELLIVVAIVAVLVAIAVPVFSGSLKSAEDAVDTANQRSVMSEALATYQLAETADKAGLATQYFYFDDKGNEVTDATKAVYGYKAAITDSNGDISVKVTGGKGDAIEKPTS